jgi:hypothetical protein
MSYNRNKAISLIYRVFQVERYTWGNSKTPPTHDEIEECVTDLENSAYSCMGGAESGRIRVNYNSDCDFYEYYLNCGDNL